MNAGCEDEKKVIILARMFAPLRVARLCPLLLDVGERHLTIATFSTYE
jgi:hypothetical protein